MSAIWPVEFNEPVRPIHQAFPRPHADIVLMGKWAHERL